MKLTFIDIKERIVTGEPLTPTERDFVLECINSALLTASAAAFLDRLAQSLSEYRLNERDAADCREWARKLRGET